jgi:protoporphyrinogen oxidase
VTQRRIAVIGAGPAGLTAAYQLQSNGVSVTLFESDSVVGGMARSFSIWGQTVDYGPHRFFSSDPRVNQFWLDAVDGNYEMVNRLTRIYYNRKFFDYPVKAVNALRGLGVFEAVRCILSYAKARILPATSESTFEDWVSNRFGFRLYSIFFKAYSEKLWGVNCRELDADFAAQRIKKLDLLETIKSAVFSNNSKSHRTLVDEFAYPVGGAGAPYENLARKFMVAKGNLKLGSPVDAVVPRADGVVEVHLLDGIIEEFDHVISTMPITKLLSRLDAPDDIVAHASQLRFRNTILVYLRVTGSSPFPDQWIYVHSPDLLTGRITNFGNWVESIRGDETDSILCLEYWCYDEDLIWQEPQETLVNRAREELYKTGLVPDGSVVDGTVRRVPKCYPVYSSGYRKHLKPIEQYLSEVSGITPIGRYGAFKYNNQDHSILMGLLAAENVLNGSENDLWSINTDYEYQESSRITETGLVNE